MSRLSESLPAYQDINNVQVTEGDLLNQQQYDEYQKVALIGANVSYQPFSGRRSPGPENSHGQQYFHHCRCAAKHRCRI